MILDDNSLEVTVEKVALAVRVYWAIVCKAMKRGVPEVNLWETPFFVNQFLKVSVSKNAMER